MQINRADASRALFILKKLNDGDHNLMVSDFHETRSMYRTIARRSGGGGIKIPLSLVYQLSPAGYLDDAAVSRVGVALRALLA